MKINLLDSFFEQVKRAADRVLLLDFDGTLAPFRTERNEAFPYPGVVEILEEIRERGRTRLVIVSGRRVRDVIPLIGMGEPPEIWGSHGWERLMTGGRRVKVLRPDKRAVEGLDQACSWIRERGWAADAERKPASLALHWRGKEASVAETMRKETSQEWRPLCRLTGLTVEDFDGGMELRAPGRDKGTVVETVLSEIPEGAVAAYLGDDLTDEDAFRAIRGRGLAVLVREEGRETAADLRLRPPGELVNFLSRWARASAS